MAASPKKPPKRGKRRTAAPETAILEAALRRAADVPWYDLYLGDVAEEAGMTLAEVHAVYADTNAIADRWFVMAQAAMLAPLPKKVAAQPVKTRLEFILWRWFAALAAERRASIGMLRSKFHLPHVHHWSPLVFSLSSHVQLWRDAAGLRAAGRRRQVEEIGLTGVFLATLAVWCGDEGEGQVRTRAFMARRLAQGDAAMARLFAADRDAA